MERYERCVYARPTYRARYNSKACRLRDRGQCYPGGNVAAIDLAAGSLVCGMNGHMQRDSSETDRVSAQQAKHPAKLLQLGCY